MTPGPWVDTFESRLPPGNHDPAPQPELDSGKSSAQPTGADEDTTAGQPGTSSEIVAVDSSSTVGHRHLPSLLFLHSTCLHEVVSCRLSVTVCSGSCYHGKTIYACACLCAETGMEPPTRVLPKRLLEKGKRSHPLPINGPRTLQVPVH